MPTEVTYYKDGKAIQIPRWCVQKAVLIGDSEQKNDFYTSITRDDLKDLIMPPHVTYYKDGKAIQIPRWCAQKAVLIGDSE
ncbi:MAG: hypothetical protein OEY79_02705 [Anaplasmataceae bacterium]|nr:hypothetical protein [Anaplasmataceae bacterium]